MIVRSMLDLRKLRRQQWLDTQELEEIQRKKLMFMIDHAYRNVRYYRRLLDSVGVKPEDIRTVRDLAKIPITSRKDIQKLSSEDTISTSIDRKKCKRILTSGSSGIPLPVYLNQRDFHYYEMVWARTFLANGQRIFDRIVDFKYHLPPKYWFEHLGVWRKAVISVHENDEQKVKKLKQLRLFLLKKPSRKRQPLKLQAKL